MATKDDALTRYRAKRDFTKTSEPDSGGERSDKALTFVIQKHAASHLHYDFRLELEGTLKSWAVPKGPSLDPGVKRMGVHVEDHPISYANFEGTIPPKQYGAGHVIVWDRGLWTPHGDPVAGLKSGKLKFDLHGEKLKGGWTLVRMHGRGDDKHEPWLLIKERDDEAREESDYSVIEALPNSVLTGEGLPGVDTGAVAEKPGATAKKSKAKSPARSSTKTAATRNGATEALSAALDDKVKPERQSATTRKPPTAIEGAIKAALPATLLPQLATLVDSVPADPAGWVYEIKFDGYRLLVRIEGKTVQCFTRNGKDWTDKLPKLVEAVKALGIKSGWLDGEIVVMNERGLPDFGALQNAFDSHSSADMLYYVFDLPYFGGLDLREVPLHARRELLRQALDGQPTSAVRFSQTFDEAPQDLLTSAQTLGLEGVIGKRVDSFYSARRSPDWIKLKTQQRQEFVIGGYTEPKGSRTGLGSLLLGVHDADGKLRYAGNVGTGFNEKSLTELKTRLSTLHALKSPFAELPSSVKGQWVEPSLLAEVSFGEWTHAGHIRHSVFHGLRTDKPARQIIRETPANVPASNKNQGLPVPKTATKKSVTAPATSMRITHGDRVIDKTSGFTKQDLVDHYAAVSALMLPHLKGRPTSLVRAPAGIEGQLFFQKHAEAGSIAGVRLLDPTLDPDHEPLLEVPTLEALIAATQLNVVEFHTWNATAKSIHKPDRMTFDLDPGEGVSWAAMQEAAQLVHAFLDELKLTSFLKTSGGKGLHVVVPLKRVHDFDTVKDFSQAIVLHLAAVIPQRFVAKSGPKNRVGKIFVDYLRNGFGATTVCAWSVRARPGMGVSVPVAWDELPSLTSGAHWTAMTLGARLATGNTPWDAYDDAANPITAAMKKLGFKPAA